MKTKYLALLLIMMPLAASAGEIDRIIDGRLAAKGIEASPRSDAERLVRRYYLVVTDRVPTEIQTQAFLDNPDREALVDSLLASDGWVRKQVLKWGDLLRIKSEFPSCMWPNAVQAYNKWLTEEFRANTPYNQFVSHLLSGTGSNFRVPQTNFYRAGNDRSTAKFTSDIALLFLGKRQAPQEWQPFFSQIKFKSTKEWKEEILCLDADVKAPAKAVSLDGKQVRIENGTDFRTPFIQWLTSSDNKEFARAYANRLWFWLMGSGIINPVDDIRPDSVPTNAELLEYLTDSFIKSGFNVRALAREILLSEAFARSTVATDSNRSDNCRWSHFPLTRLSAEQICDAICDITETSDKYSSRAPEPFTNFPEGTRSNEVCDGTITTPQLDIFGRPSRDVALESGRNNSVNSKQMLYLLNSTDIQEKLKASPYIQRVSRSDSMRSMADAIYLRVLARHATAQELDVFEKWAKKACYNVKRDAAESLVWALLNTDEFLFIN